MDFYNYFQEFHCLASSSLNWLFAIPDLLLFLYLMFSFFLYVIYHMDIQFFKQENQFFGCLKGRKFKRFSFQFSPRYLDKIKLKSITPCVNYRISSNKRQVSIERLPLTSIVQFYTQIKIGAAL